MKELVKVSKNGSGQQEVLDNGKVVYHRKWTQIGREFIVKLLQK